MAWSRLPLTVTFAVYTILASVIWILDLIHVSHPPELIALFSLLMAIIAVGIIVKKMWPDDLSLNSFSTLLVLVIPILFIPSFILGYWSFLGIEFNAFLLFLTSVSGMVLEALAMAFERGH